jgi:hypothetical protein
MRRVTAGAIREGVVSGILRGVAFGAAQSITMSQMAGVAVEFGVGVASFFRSCRDIRMAGRTGLAGIGQGGEFEIERGMGRMTAGALGQRIVVLTCGIMARTAGCDFGFGPFLGMNPVTVVTADEFAVSAALLGNLSGLVRMAFGAVLEHAPGCALLRRPG